MKLKKTTMLLRTYRKEWQSQINILLDFLPDFDDYDQRGKILKEIYAIRAKIKLTEGFGVVQLAKPIEFNEVTLNSRINGIINIPKPEHTPSNKPIVDTYQFSQRLSG